MKEHPKIYIIFGPSGSGKNFIANFLPLKKLVSVTTRTPREGEWNGKDYYFVTKEEFFKLDLIEYAEYYGNFYGLTKQEVENITEDSVHIMEINGAKKIKEMYPERTILLYLNTDYENRKKRMLERGDSLESVEFRLSKSKQEEENRKFADYVIDNNHNITMALQQIIRIIIKEETNE